MNSPELTLPLFSAKPKYGKLPRYHIVSEIYVQTTLNQGRMEGAPIAILEAMANGKVVIGSDIPGIRDQLEQFSNHLFEAGNISDLSEKLVCFMSNDKTTNLNIGNKFLDFVKKTFDISFEKKNIELYYKNLMQN